MTLASLLAVAALAVNPAESALAVADYNARIALHDECRYLSGVSERDEGIVRYGIVMATREPLLDATVPQRMPGTSMLRISLTSLRWTVSDWIKICGHKANGYTPHENPLVVPAAFLVDRISDQTQSDAYLRFYFGGSKIPKTLNEFLAAVGAKERTAFAFGLVEGQSRVNLSKNGVRLLRHDDGTDVEVWTTFDVKKPTKGRDPLAADALLGHFKFDGAETFALVPRVATDGTRALLPVSCLSAGDGKIVAEAPVDLVEDWTRPKGIPSIRNPLGCITCHTAGSQQPTVNALRDRLEDGIKLYTLDKRQALAVELFHLGAVETDLKRWDAGLTSLLAYVNGLSTYENATRFKGYVGRYAEDLSLMSAASELHCTEEDLTLALGYASANRIDTGSRLVDFTRGKLVPRSAFEGDYLQAQAILEIWRAKR